MLHYGLIVGFDREPAGAKSAVEIRVWGVLEHQKILIATIEKNPAEPPLGTSFEETDQSDTGVRSGSLCCDYDTKMVSGG